MPSRNRYRAANEDEKLEDEVPEEQAENQDEELNASADDEDIEAEDDLSEKNAEDEDDTLNAENDEPKQKNAKAIYLQERQRSAGLMQLAKTAKKLGVSFDAAKAIVNGTSLSVARKHILNAAIIKDRNMQISSNVSNNDRHFGGVSSSQAKSMWKKAKGAK